MKNTIQEILKKLINLKVNPEIEQSFFYFSQSIAIDEVVIKSFLHIIQNPNPKFQGLALEAIMITKNNIYDIVIGTENMEINTLWISDILKVEIQLNASEPKHLIQNIEQQNNEEFYCQLNLTFNTNNTYLLFYRASVEKLPKFLEIRNTILSLK